MKRIECQIEIGKLYCFFNTKELVFRCPSCKRDYTYNRKICMHCRKTKKQKIELKQHTKRRTGLISLEDLSKYSCSCIHGSYYGLSKAKIKKRLEEKKEICKHYRWCKTQLNKLKQVI